MMKMLPSSELKMGPAMSNGLNRPVSMRRLAEYFGYQVYLFYVYPLNVLQLIFLIV